MCALGRAPNTLVDSSSAHRKYVFMKTNRLARILSKYTFAAAATTTTTINYCRRATHYSIEGKKKLIRYLFSIENVFLSLRRVSDLINRNVSTEKTNKRIWSGKNDKNRQICV